MILFVCSYTGRPQEMMTKERSLFTTTSIGFFYYIRLEWLASIIIIEMVWLLFNILHVWNGITWLWAGKGLTNDVNYLFFPELILIDMFMKRHQPALCLSLSARAIRVLAFWSWRPWIFVIAADNLIIYFIYWHNVLKIATILCGYLWGGIIPHSTCQSL